MTRTHAALQLLALGPLTFSEFREITGWPPRSCSFLLRNLSQEGRAELEGKFWRLADDVQRAAEVADHDGQDARVGSVRVGQGEAARSVRIGAMAGHSHAAQRGHAGAAR